MSYEQSVIAEVQARYGAPVTGGVQVIPQGKSGMPEIYWDDKEGQLRYRQAGGETLNGPNTIQHAKNVMRSAHMRKQKFERAAKKAEQPPKPARKPSLGEMYGGRIQFLAAEGKTGPETAEETGLKLDTMRTIASRLGIDIPRVKRIGNTKPVGCISAKVKERRAAIVELLAAGKTQGAILDGLDVSAKTFREDLRVLGLKADLRGSEKAAWPARRCVSDKTCASVMELHAKGLTSRQIADSLGVHEATVRRSLRVTGASANVAPRKVKPEILERRALIISLSAAGMSYRQIREKTGASLSCIGTALASLKVAA